MTVSTRCDDDPDLARAVRVNVVVEVNTSETLPVLGTLPTCGSIRTVVESPPTTSQRSTANVPPLIVKASAEKLEMIGASVGDVDEHAGSTSTNASASSKPFI
jgi:hypothetical protein